MKSFQHFRSSNRIWTLETKSNHNLVLEIFRKFDLGGQTGHQADPQKVSNDMRKAARDEQNNRLFAREEWLTKSQVQGFFSRLAATRRRQQGSAEIHFNPRDLLLEDEEFERQRLIAEVANELRPQHPLSYNAFNLCESARKKKKTAKSVQRSSAETDLVSF